MAAGAREECSNGQFSSVPGPQRLVDDLQSLNTDDRLSITERKTLGNARIGQGSYRAALIEVWGCCSVTGYEFQPMLIASHIKPWRAATNNERRDPDNGLLLIPSIDKAFDNGYLTFTDAGHAQLSDEIESPDTIGLHGTLRVSVRAGMRDYLAFHREVCFRG